MARKLLLDKVHVEGIRHYDVYRREGGYRSVEKALKMVCQQRLQLQMSILRYGE